ncbi:hypothetical protein [Bradyrhizobium sp. SZCCHNRI3042]|uniref:hypothetical protein n=1 Tax=Bradyrhizobium sp. SZCCHNRI3042 TaxID=3057291 RepID=UPI002915F04B|nr:hypothetical protein [Bradyrhizobium sp. SZCCHNRI3042]
MMIAHTEFLWGQTEMHQSLQSLLDQLEKAVQLLQSTISSDQTFAVAHNNWSFPNIGRAELIAKAQSIADLIEAEGADEVGEQEALLNEWVKRITYIQQQVIPNIWGNPPAGVAAYMFAMDGLREAIEPSLKGDSRKAAIAQLKKLRTQIGALESRFNDLEPRSASIDDKVTAIEQAYDAADKLPENLESLRAAQREMHELLDKARTNQVLLSQMRDEGEFIRGELGRLAAEAANVLKQSETAYSAATSVGLAAAFSERSRSLGWSMWVWVGGLVTALVVGSFFGTERIKALVDLFKDPNQTTSIILPNVILSIITVGAPIWLAWLSTKQIGQRFRLAEDYAFKASISRAYEGFRREAARIDKELEARLLASALARLDELPLRLVEAETHGSPWQELANSEIVKEALKSVPGFAREVSQIAERAVASVNPLRKGRELPVVSATTEENK